MRKLVVAALVGVLTLAVTAIAIAASATSGTTVQNYDQSFVNKRAKSLTKTATSTGTAFETSSTDEQNTAKNKQPKRVTDFDITFPRGTKINNNAIPRCNADETDFANAEKPDDACPPGSAIGSGKVEARLPFRANTASGDIEDGEVYAYNARKGLLLFVSLPSASQTLLLKPKFKGTKLMTDVPHTCVPPNIPENDCKDPTGERQEAILTKFSLVTKPKSTGRGAKKKNLITTPKTCPKAGWKFEANIKYADGTSVKIPSISKCKS